MTGSGTQADPYIIYDVDDLQAMESDVAAYYELANDIDALATSGWNAGAGFAPIGLFPYFTGSLDGKGYEVDALFINRPATNMVGLFAMLDGEVKNLGLTNVDITGQMTGGFVGTNLGTITSCYITGTVTGNSRAGGFVYENMGTITECYSTCTVTDNVGYASGFVDTNWGTTERCFATGDVTADDNGGGFVRLNFIGTIRNCYARGNVESVTNDPLGGFVDRNSDTIENCYSTGSLTTTGTKGGFCRQNAGTITNCFWDTETSGQATSDGGTGKTTAQMKTQSTFTDAGWDFIIWGMVPACNDDYSCLRGVNACCPEIGLGGGNPGVIELLT